MLKTLNILTIFPDIVTEWTKYGIVNQGIKKKLINIDIYDLREWGKGKHKQVDDSPYGGGPGMVMMVEPLDKAINEINSEKSIFMMPSGSELTEEIAKELVEYESLTIICGRYEGFDHRIIEMHGDYTISVGKTVVSGGEIPSLFLMESLIRKIPNILGNKDSLSYETFTEGAIDFPAYTRPEEYKGHKVPEILLSGNHKEIDEWKKNNLRDI